MAKKRLLKVRKRDGRLISFNPAKITDAIKKAMDAVSEKDARLAKKLTDDVLGLIPKRVKGIPNIEQIQDIVEETLVPYNRIAKAYMLYRKSRTKAREIKEFFGIKDDMKLDVNAIKILQERYLLKDNQGNIVETPTQMFRRVAKAVADVDKMYGKNPKKSEENFFNVMKNLEFLPNSPTLMNAGTKLGQLSACFVLPVEDSLESIFTTLKHMALIQQSGGGTGFSFSHLRPRGDIVSSTKGTASGAVSFIKIYDSTTEIIKQGGKRRGANMAVLDIHHPDVLEFIESKRKTKQLTNFNISVATSDRFLDSVSKNKAYELINPRDGKVAYRINARKIFDLICRCAWETGDPGMIFIDEINRKNKLISLGRIEATNPCGEVPLLPYESCNLGSINLSKIVENEKINWNKLKELVHLGIHFLDNVIDANDYLLPEIENNVKSNRRIGLGVMGFADMLINVGIRYDSQKALKLAERLMKFINKEAHAKSEELAKQRGVFPSFKHSRLKRKMRNCACTTIAPTGTIGIIAGCSSGIEPLFALAFVRDVMEGKKLFEVNKDLQTALIKNEIYSGALIRRIMMRGNLKGVAVPDRIKNIFRTALEIKPQWHVKIQAAFQKHVDNAVSKTINLPNSASIKDVRNAYLLAHKLRCKGITIYRYGSKPEQVLYLGKGNKYSKATLDFTGTCVGNTCQL